MILQKVSAVSFPLLLSNCSSGVSHFKSKQNLYNMCTHTLSRECKKPWRYKVKGCHFSRQFFLWSHSRFRNLSICIYTGFLSNFCYDNMHTCADVLVYAGGRWSQQERCRFFHTYTQLSTTSVAEGHSNAMQINPLKSQGKPHFVSSLDFPHNIVIGGQMYDLR